MIIVMLGAPGAGKGTIGKQLAKDIKAHYITTGDAFRSIMNEQTELGIKIKDAIESGRLVPDELAIKIFEEEVLPKDLNHDIILDGYPRTEEQAKHLKEYLESNNLAVNAVINIDVPYELIIDRMVNRRICPNCKAIYNLKYGKKPQTENICDECGTNLIQRTDDNEKTIRDRLTTYEINTKPLIHYYKEQEKLINIVSDENTSIDELVKQAKEYTKK